MIYTLSTSEVEQLYISGIKKSCFTGKKSHPVKQPVDPKQRVMVYFSSEVSPLLPSPAAALSRSPKVEGAAASASSFFLA